MNRIGRRRLAYLAAALVIIACGLVWRRPELGLPGPVAKYGGSVLWGAMVFFLVAAATPRRNLFAAAALAAALAAMVEASQLIRYAPLDQFRSTVVGALLLGRTFAWWDILAYWVGIAAACILAVLAGLRGRRAPLLMAGEEDVRPRSP